MVLKNENICCWVMGICRSNNLGACDKWIGSSCFFTY